MSSSQTPRLFRDAVLLLTGVRALRAVGLQPTGVFGGTTIGFFAGNMAGVYGFDARDTLTHVNKAMDGKIDWGKVE